MAGATVRRQFAGWLAAWLIEWFTHADHLVLLATGTGFAGVFPILMAALHDRRMASVTLYWGGRA